MRRLRRNSINNSNKIIIGISIMFSTIILIIGVTTAYFSQGASNNIGEITATDLTKTLDYTDNNDYMRGNLIPVSDTDVVRFAMQNSAMNSYGQEENGNVVSGNNVSSNTVSGNSVDGNNVNNYYYIDDDICRYTDDMNACSVYEFTIKNTSDVVQKINATLTPNPNTFKNLYYMIYEEEQEKLTPSSKLIKKSTHINETDTSNMFEEVVLTPNEEKTYTLVFYINAMDYDQTGEDSGKNFGAIVSVNSLTTGYNVTKTYGDTCYDVEKINGGEYDGLFKITKFKGIDTNGVPVAGCGVTPSGDNPEYYTVVVPSNVGDYEINVIGDSAFDYSNISTLTIPKSVQTIGDYAFYYNNNLEELTFQGALDGSSQLKTIGDYAFHNSNISTLTIPKSVQTIGDYAFSSGNYTLEKTNLTTLTFGGAEDGSSQLKTIGNSAFKNTKISTLTIPKSVKAIGDEAFMGIVSLFQLKFMIEEDGTSELRSIGNSAFNGCRIYSTNDETLYIPSTVTYIGSGAFADNYTALSHIRFTGDTTGFGTYWNGAATLITK